MQNDTGPDRRPAAASRRAPWRVNLPRVLGLLINLALWAGIIALGIVLVRHARH